MSITNGGPQLDRSEASLDPHHLLLVGAGPGLGSAVARRFAREGYRVTLVARSVATLVPIAQELGAAGAAVASVQADAGEAAGLRAALAPVFAAPRAPGIVIYNASLMAFDDLLTVGPEQLADAYAVNVIGAVGTAQLAVRAMRVAGGGTLLFTGGGFADALPATLATLSLGKVTLRALATMLARELREDGIHAASLTILGQIAPGTPFDPDRIADAYWEIAHEDPAAWREEYRFDGAAVLGSTER